MPAPCGTRPQSSRLYLFSSPHLLLPQYYFSDSNIQTLWTFRCPLSLLLSQGFIDSSGTGESLPHLPLIALIRSPHCGSKNSELLYGVRWSGMQ